MERYDVIEFSKIYKRVLDIETTLKHNLYCALLKTYGKNLFTRLFEYLDNEKLQKKYIRNNRNWIKDLITSRDDEENKLSKFISNAYLIDVLNILTGYKKIHKDKRFRKNFYGITVDLNMLKQKASSINKLRNSIMHFDITTYKDNKDLFLKTLTYWEKLLSTPYMSSIHSISPINKLNTSKILKALGEQYKDFYKLSDRLVCDMFDDAAFVNGWDISKLPEYWTIVRTLYKLRRENKEKS